MAGFGSRWWRLPYPAAAEDVSEWEFVPVEQVDPQREGATRTWAYLEGTTLYGSHKDGERWRRRRLTSGPEAQTGWEEDSALLWAATVPVLRLRRFPGDPTT